MASIAQIPGKQQEGQGTQETLNEQDSYRLVIRFGKDLLQDGFTAIPNLLLDLYAELGITHCELVFLLHLLQYKWSKAEPYPSLSTIATKMGLSLRAVQNHVQSLRHKALHCPHTDNPQECDCPKYLVVTPRYRVGMGQTSNSYNLSGLFAAVLNLAREKGLLPAADHAEKCTPPRETSCMGGMKEVAYESDVSKKTQPESDESFSKLGGGFVESTPACNQREHGVLQKEVGQGSCSHEVVATRNPQETESESASPSSPHRNPESASYTHPSLPHRAESSKPETPPSREPGRVRQSFFTKDEVKRDARELPRIKPYTQDEINALRKEGKNASGQTPLQAILDEMIPREHQQTLTREYGQMESAREVRCKPMPVYPQLQQRIEEISLELNNFQVVTRNIIQTDNIRKEAGVSLEQMLDAIGDAYRATRIALQKGTIAKKDEAGRPVSMPYFFKCLRQKVGLTQAKAR